MEAKEIKFANGILLHIDEEEEFYQNMEALDIIHIPEEAKTEIIRNLICFRTLDLSKAYGNHTVILKLI